MELVNMMEEVANHFLEDVWAKEKMCKCYKCRFDVLAKTLNVLKPRYLVTDRGKAFSRADFLETQNNVDVLTALSAAIRIVKENPHH
ncbi:MAG: late competence development ComFB family protein [Firmicutes bacterium]|nr:late competence development ComFB family protein [Bacillota bacterium]